MKRTVGPARPDNAKSSDSTETRSDPLSVLSRIQLAFLEDYTTEKRGYDPYDTSKDRMAQPWSFTRKRA